MQTVQMLKAAMQERAPALFESLQASGGLNAHVQDLADQISSTAVDLTQQQRMREGWDKLGPMECAAKMKMAAALNREIALSQALEFPQDETSRQSPDETTSSDQTT